MMFIFKAISPEELNMNHFYDPNENKEKKITENASQRVPYMAQNNSLKNVSILPLYGITTIPLNKSERKKKTTVPQII